MQPSPYRNLILDLGGVLYAIDLARSLRAFAALATQPVQDAAQMLHDPLFQRFERGELTPQEFRDALRKRFALSGDDAALDAAWNALLLGVIPGREELVGRLAQRWNVVLLSNTNQIHYDALYEECGVLFAQFGSCHFSFRMGLRKPEAGIYHRVLEQQGWKARETILIDDAETNLAGARQVGMGALHFTGEGDWDKWMGGVL